MYNFVHIQPAGYTETFQKRLVKTFQCSTFIMFYGNITIYTTRTTIHLAQSMRSCFHKLSWRGASLRVDESENVVHILLKHLVTHVNFFSTEKVNLIPDDYEILFDVEIINYASKKSLL